jgi:DNA-binding transcriptional ArsR family regulator
MKDKLKLCLAALIDLFEESIKNTDYSDDINNIERDRYWKWVSTVDIAHKLKIRPSQLRPTLNKLEELGYVTSKREPNWIRWAANKIEGFEQHKFEDYYKKTNNEKT